MKFSQTIMNLVKGIKYTTSPSEIISEDRSYNDT